MIALGLALSSAATMRSPIAVAAFAADGLRQQKGVVLNKDMVVNTDRTFHKSAD